MHFEPSDPQLGVIYCRMSEDREGAGLGIDRQCEDCEALANQLNITIVDYYADNDLSAYSGKPRPDYLRLLSDLRAGRAGSVIAWHTDRLHRSPTELEEYIDVCEPRRIETRTVKAGHLDLTTATGRMIARQLGVQARYEVERMVERQKRAREQKAGKGEYCGGPRPYGWASDGVTQIADEAAVLREMCEAVLAGASMRSIAADLNRRGVPTSTGKGRWEGITIRQMLLRPRNAGISVLRGEEVGPAVWEPVLDEGSWRSLVAILRDPARIPTASNVRKHLGGGLYLCGVCGASLKSGYKGQTAKLTYFCRANMCVSRNMEYLDDHVKLQLIGRLSEPGIAERLSAREANVVDVRGAQRTMAAARAMLEELATSLGSGEMDMQEWRAASAAAKRRLAQAESEMSHAVRVNPVAELLVTEDVAAAFVKLDLSRQRAAIDYLMTVKVHRAVRGRQTGGRYWDPSTVEIVFK